MIVPAATGLRGECLLNEIRPRRRDRPRDRPGPPLPGGQQQLALHLAGPLAAQGLAPGATAVHLTQSVQPGSDVVATALTRYQAHDAAAGLVVALAGGCALYGLDETSGRPASHRFDGVPESSLRRPGQAGERALVCLPEVAAALR